MSRAKYEFPRNMKGDIDVNFTPLTGSLAVSLLLCKVAQPLVAIG
jgi:hypothetical protein